MDWDKEYECPRCGTLVTPREAEFATWGGAEGNCYKCGCHHPVFDVLEGEDDEEVSQEGI